MSTLGYHIHTGMSENNITYRLVFHNTLATLRLHTSDTHSLSSMLHLAQHLFCQTQLLMFTNWNHSHTHMHFYNWDLPHLLWYSLMIRQNKKKGVIDSLPSDWNVSQCDISATGVLASNPISMLHYECDISTPWS